MRAPAQLFDRDLKFVFALTIGWLTVPFLTFNASAADAKLPSFPLPVDQEHSTTARQLAKPILESRLLDDMESTEHWQLFGPGHMALSSERCRDGRQAIRLNSPTKLGEPPRVQGRPFGETGIRRVVEQEDWSDFNRISFWVFPDLPGFHNPSLLVKLQSEGTAGRSYTDGAMHFVLLRNQQWNHVTWEITHLERKQVKAVELIYRLQGNEPGATDQVRFDFDCLELQRVQPEHYRGWAVAPGTIAYSHAGYSPEAAKLAFIAPGEREQFELVNLSSGKVVWRGNPGLADSPSGPVQVLDFSRFQKPGKYQLRAGKLHSAPFAIGKYAWRETLIAGLNFFYCERCGFTVPGIHGVCHQDWRVEHDGRTLPINGGWHDAGDLSQGLVNTAEAAWSMLRLAERLQKRDPRLADRFREEARWGVEWLLKTRFGDGSRVVWATMDFWTDGVQGNADDVVVKAGNSPFDNFLAAAAQAAAARAFTRRDRAFADTCRAAAEFDYSFARSQSRDPNVELSGAAAQSGIELFRLTGKAEYLDHAARYAEVILSSQEKDRPRWEKPLSGFFYTSPRKQRILHYNHRSHEQAPVVALVDLCGLRPRDPQMPAWRSAVQNYGNYLLETSRMTGPCRMIPAGIYRVADTSDASQQKQIQEGVRLSDGIYLRRFPVWSDFRGNLGVLLSQATAAASAGRLLQSAELRQLATAQLEWTLGRNPFCQSLMYGVGQNYAPQYTAMSGDITGSLPVGIQSRLHEDLPYWPPSNCYNYAEVWVHPVSRWFTTIAELWD